MFLTSWSVANRDCDVLYVLLQDTAGQERFSSLASAFFRGADAVILMFDVNKPETLGGLTKWWNNFKERAPVPDEEAEDYCCVLVGNKIDLALAGGDGKKETVSEAQAVQFMEELIPQKTANAVEADDGLDSDGEETTADEDERTNGHAEPASPADGGGDDDDPLSRSSPPKSDSIQIRRADSSSSHPYAKRPRKPGHRRGDSSQSQSRKRGASASASRSDDRLAAHFVAGGTMTTTHTIYHTPASSLFESESFASAQSSPFASASSVDTVHLSPDSTAAAANASPVPAPAPAGSLHGRRMTSASSSSSSSAPTITPSLYQRAHSSTSAAVMQPSPLGTPAVSAAELPSVSAPDLPSPSASATATTTLEVNGNGASAKDLRHRLPPYPERRPKLFFTSAKTGAGVAPVFEYVARRVVMKWEYEEALEARRMHVREATETIRLADARRGTMGKLAERLSCCGS